MHLLLCSSIAVAIYQAPDVRPILKKYEGQDIGPAYAKFEAEVKQRQVDEWKAKGGESRRAPVVNKVTLSSLFSNTAPSPHAFDDPSQPPATYLELKRREAQEYYQKEQQWLKDNEEEIKKMVEEQKQQMMGEMGGSLLGFLTGAGPKPPPTSDPNAPPSSLSPPSLPDGAPPAK